MTASNNSQPSAPVRILVAEDSPLNLQVALKQLEKLGFAADGVPDGAKALEAMQRTPYDIILMDCQMPELNGYEATWQIRHQQKERIHRGEEAAKRPYIIAMTANSRSDDREKCRQAGMDDYISKPVELRELDAALQRGLGASEKAVEDVIDPVVIAGLRQLRIPGRPDPLVELIDLFLQEAPMQIQALELAVKENDQTSLVRSLSAASALKGSASNVGARSLAALCEEIEQTARGWSFADVQPLIERAREVLGDVAKALGTVKQSDARRTTVVF